MVPGVSLQCEKWMCSGNIDWYISRLIVVRLTPYQDIHRSSSCVSWHQDRSFKSKEYNLCNSMLCHGLGNVGRSFLRHPNGMGILEIHGVLYIRILERGINCAIIPRSIKPVLVNLRVHQKSVPNFMPIVLLKWESPPNETGWRLTLFILYQRFGRSSGFPLNLPTLRHCAKGLIQLHMRPALS